MSPPIEDGLAVPTDDYDAEADATLDPLATNSDRFTPSSSTSAASNRRSLENLCREHRPNLLLIAIRAEVFRDGRFVR